MKWLKVKPKVTSPVTPIGEQTAAPAWGKNRFWRLLNIASILAALLILWALVISTEGFSGLFRKWRDLDWRWMAAALGSMGIYWLLEGSVVAVLTRGLYKGVPFRSSWRTAMVGQLYSALTPFASGGQPFQVVYMQQDGLDTGGAASVITMKSVFYQIATLLYALMAAIFSYGLFASMVPGFVWWALGGTFINLLVTGALLMVLYSPRVTRTMYRALFNLLGKLRLMKNPQVAMEKAQNQVDIFHQSALYFQKRRGNLLLSGLFTLIQLFFLYIIPYFVYRACGNQGTQPMIMLYAVAMVTMISAFIPLPGGSGGAEGTFYLFFMPFFSLETLMIGLLIWRIITYYSVLVVGALVVMVTRRNKRAFTRLGDE